MAPKVQLAAAPVERGKQLWTWDGTLASFVGLGRFPVRMVIAGYNLPHNRLGLVVIAPLNPTPAVVEWLQQTGDVNFVVAPNKVGAAGAKQCYRVVVGWPTRSSCPCTLYTAVSIQFFPCSGAYLKRRAPTSAVEPGSCTSDTVDHTRQAVLLHKVVSASA